VGTQPGTSGAEPVAAVYSRALPQVYGYLLPRCGSTAVAEDLTAETFMAAVAAVSRGRVRGADVTVAWLVGVARHKLADHWRRTARERRSLASVAPLPEDADDPWDVHLDAQVAHAALARMAGPQRAALTLRYLDGLPVGEVAACLGRSLHATETLLVRLRAALRRVYREESGADA
jgi:RNA polymerase sigma-70 factor (ECF subfamily)